MEPNGDTMPLKEVNGGVVRKRTDRDAAFGEFVAGRYLSLVRFGYLLVGDRGQAEDLAQSALLRAYGAWRGVRDVANAEAYTRRIMVRLAVRWRRRGWHREIPADLVATEAAAVGGDPYAQCDLAATVRSALRQLPAHQRAVVILRFYADLTPVEVAAVLGCSVGTVKSRTHRALAALRSTGLLQLDDEPAGEGPDD